MLPELIKGYCTMFGAHYLNVSGALDWDTDGTFEDYPTILLYHSSATNGNVFATLAWMEFIGYQNRE